MLRTNAILLLLFCSSWAFAVDPLSLQAALAGRTLRVELNGISREKLAVTLEKGMSALLGLELQVYEPGLLFRRLLVEDTIRRGLQMDFFEQQPQFEQSYGSGGQHVECATPQVLDDFVCELTALPPATAEIRVRAVWEPIELLPALRFIRHVIPGLQRSTAWVSVERGDQ